MSLFPNIHSFVDGSGILQLSGSTFQSSQVVDIRFLVSTEGSVDPCAGDSVVLLARSSATALPVVLSSATLDDDHVARLTFPLALPGFGAYDEDLQPKFRPGGDTFQSMICRMALSRSYNGQNASLATSHPIYLAPGIPDGLLPGAPDAHYYITDELGNPYRIIVVNPEGLGLALALEEMPQ